MKRILMIQAILALAATACGGSKTPEGPPGVTQGPVTLSGQVANHGTKQITGAKPSITLEVEDDYFEPTFLKMDRGATVSLKLENKGTHSHTFTIEALRVDQLLAPGETKTLAFTLPAEPGANFVCKFHRPTGMQGAFFYTEGASFVSGGSPSESPADGDEGYNY